MAEEEHTENYRNYQQRQKFQVPDQMLSQLKDFVSPSKWASVSIQFRLKADRGLLKKGDVIAKAQFELQPYQFPKVDEILAAAGTGTVQKDDAKAWLTLSAAGTSVTAQPRCASKRGTI